MKRTVSRSGTSGVLVWALLWTQAATPLPAQTAQAPAPPSGTASSPVAAPKPASSRPSPGQPAAAKPKAASTSAAPAAKDPGWPRVYSDGKATLTVHQPQVDDWKDFQLLEARMAVEILPGKEEKKVMAAVHWQAKTNTNLDQRTVAMGEIEITRFHAPGMDEAKSRELQALTVSLLPKSHDALALDRILPYLDQSRLTGRQVKISTEAPPILVSSKPAILVMIDGQPILGPVENTKLTYVVNTNWDLFKDGKDGDYFLLNGRHWLTSETLEGPWKAASKLPKEINSLPDNENWKDVKAALPLGGGNKETPAPWVYVSNKPAELILIEGEPKLAPVAGTQLAEVTNTKSLLFFHAGTKHYYFLTSGRWFKNQQLRGNWVFTSDQLPADFQQFPVSHPKSHVRTSIPGTAEAADAVLLASIPQVAVINRKEAAAEAKVVYVGEPEFKPVTGTSLQYAVNTPADVIQAEGRYYLCQEGVWFVSDSAKGPWEVADMIPQEIYKIPPDSPKHNTTYVYVTNSDSNTVTTAQTAGYAGLAIGIGIGVAVWGTGYYYPPYYYYGPMYPYPVYWGYPYYSYGAAAWYNPATGFYGRGGFAYGPYGGYGRAAAYNPATGTYARRAGAYGPYQAGVATSFYNPRTGAWGGGYRYANPYQGWGQGVVAKGDQWARGGYYYDERGAIGGIRTSEGGKLVAAGNGENRGFVGRTSDGDLYVGKNGEIYRRDESGNWQHRDSGGWNSVNYDSLSTEQKQRVDNAKQKAGQSPQNRASNRAQSGTPQAGTMDRAQPGTSTRPQPGTMDRAQGAGGRAQPGTLDRPQPGTLDRPQPGTLDRPQPGQLDRGTASRESAGARPSSGSIGEAQRSRPSNFDRDVASGLDRDAGARARGNQNVGSMRSSGGGRSMGGSYRGGGGRMGGGRRR